MWAGNALARLFTQQPASWDVAPPPPPPRREPEPSAPSEDFASLRRELDELKRSLEKKPRRR